MSQDLEKCFNEINELINSSISKTKNIKYDKLLIEKHVKKLSD